ncbi:MAG: T9SS type A sorting domain-containing protein [Bacteroidota bacterium]
MRRMIFSLVFLFFFSTIVFPQSNFWEPTNASFGKSITSIAINSNGDIFAAANSVYRSTNLGNTWENLSLPETAPSITVVATAPNGKLFVGGYGAIINSTNNGDNWAKQTLIINDQSGQFYDVTSFTVRSDTVIFAGTMGGSLYFSDNGGNNWWKTGSGGTDFINAVMLDSREYIFTGDHNGVVANSQTGSGGWDWAMPLYSEISSIATVAPSLVFAATPEYGVYRSTNNGSTFTAANNGLTRRTATAMVANTQGVLFVGTDSAGVFRSTNQGDSWIQINSGLIDVHICPNWNGHQPMAFDPNGYLFVGTQNGKIFRSVQSTVTYVQEFSQGFPQDYILEQNYPNPFNPVTTIRYEVPVTGMITLKVFDMLGREVTTLVNEEKTVGSHAIRFDGSNLSGGLYFYRLNAGNYAVTKKMTLTK